MWAWKLPKAELSSQTSRVEGDNLNDRTTKAMSTPQTLVAFVHELIVKGLLSNHWC